MITLKQRNTKWRIQIGDEIWEFKDLKELQHNLNILLEIKNKYGQLKREE